MQRRNKQEIFTKNFEEKNENEKLSDFFLAISLMFSEFVEKTILIRKIVHFLGF